MFTLVFVKAKDVEAIGWSYKANSGNTKVWAFENMKDNEIPKYLNQCKEDAQKGDLIVVLPGDSQSSAQAFADLADKVIVHNQAQKSARRNKWDSQYTNTEQT